jgi:ParB family chromosome partitioning protein
MVAVSTAVEAIGPSFFYPDMPLEQLRPSPMNPRKHFDQASLEELANNIREVGLLQPIVARLHGDHYEIVAGERRYRASQIAGLSTVPVSVKTLSDTQALEVMVIENNQREDISALEESEGFRQLLAAGYEIDDSPSVLAARRNTSTTESSCATSRRRPGSCSTPAS